MAAQVYYSWAALGRPLEPATPIRELVGQLKAAYPQHADRFSWFANEEHYTAVPPQDHTPYSFDGWPLPDPQWVVFATDIMVDAVGGTTEAQRIFDHLMASAKNGKAPWIKYLIWKATIYDVRHGWAAQANSGHFDHIHVSARTDFRFAHLGSWSVVPEENDMTPQQATQLADVWRFLGALGEGKDSVAYADGDGRTPLAPLYERIAELSATKTVAALPPGQGGGPTEDQIREIVRQELDKTRLAGA